MYYGFLTKVHKVIDETIGRKQTNNEKTEVFFNSMFNPEAYAMHMAEQRKKEELRQKLVVGTTIIAAVGEGFHLAKRAGIIDKITKR